MRRQDSGGYPAASTSLEGRCDRARLGCLPGLGERTNVGEAEKKVDESWKERVSREKAELVEPEKAKGAGPKPEAAEAAGAGAGEEPPPQADFLTLVAGLAGQAAIHLGMVEHPIEKQLKKDLRQARYTIDLLGVLEEKTRGNLNAEESRVFSMLLTDLRMRYVEAAGR